MGLSVSNIVKKYGDYTAVDDLSFEMTSPGVFALLGTNGAGKTTTIRIILGMLAAESGEVRWDGKTFLAAGMPIGYLAEERGLYPKIKIMDQLIYFCTLKGMLRRDAVKALDYWFERLSVTEHKNKRAEQLSKGNQQKIQLIAALAPNPELIILDEPLSGLDPVNAELFKGVIREEIKRNKYIIMSSHQMTTIEEFCRDIVIMNKGKTVLQGNLNEIKKGYGRVKLTVKAEGDVSALAAECGLTTAEETPNGSSFNVRSEEQAHKLLNMIIERGIPLIRYELREPTLNEIFIEKAGGQNED
ncbi:MAG: ATP-binding cassette domain-containing protein [Lachnospiraceae bacterium]|nr:ATP-binding cassette domain-containing protein [Ruminococcus sp.]MCM1274964.1 ATP-binding cassette domain-containing protein [Lachnospiraceae bacterium]